MGKHAESILALQRGLLLIALTPIVCAATVGIVAAFYARFIGA